MIRKYCKAYYLKDLRQWSHWTEKREESEAELTDEDVVYLWDDFVVVRSPVLPGGVIFDTVTPEWQDFCHTTDRLTHYAANASRGRAALDAIGIAPQFRGTSVHDGLVSYQGYSSTQALCHVHHLRELTFVEEELKQPWARGMKDLLLEMKTEVERAKAAGEDHLDVPSLSRLVSRYDVLLTEGYKAHPPPPPPKKSEQGKRTPGRPKQSPACNLLDRLSTRKDAVLRFLYDFAVPIDRQSGGERSSHESSVQQKVSGCFRTEEGIALFCRIRSYLSSLRKQGIALLSALEQALTGHPVSPAFS